MSKKNIYVIKDKLALDFNYPFFAISDLVALRTVLEGPKGFDLNTFELYYIGDFDHDSGLIVGSESPVFICSLSDAEALYNKLKSEL